LHKIPDIKVSYFLILNKYKSPGLGAFIRYNRHIKKELNFRT